MTTEKPIQPNTDFNSLIQAIKNTDTQLAAQARRAVNVSLTIRNWLIGCHIAEFELHGSDRAGYGENLLGELAQELGKHCVSNCGRRQLYGYLSFYRTYPQIVRAVTAQFDSLLPTLTEDRKNNKVPSATAQLTIPPEKLLNSLSYTHLELLVRINDNLKRSFYELECLRSNWSVRELKRQIASLYFERSGLSINKEKLANITINDAESISQNLNIRDPYIFEFLGLKSKEVMGESDLEDALLDKLQDFLLELGHGFCFEARQKRILIGDSHYFVDLVFYHRILKCHILLELKVDEFNHEHIGQLNTYVSWYKKNQMTKDDNPPIGLLLCTHKNHPLVEYALAGMDNQIFVSKYQLELPEKEAIEHFLEQQLQENKK